MTLAKIQQRFDEMAHWTGVSRAVHLQAVIWWCAAGVLQGHQLLELADWVFESLLEGEVHRESPPTNPIPYPIPYM